MALYSLLLILCALGGMGVFRVTRKSGTIATGSHWLKFIIYVALVFGQLFLITNQYYVGFAVLVVCAGLYEMWRIASTKKMFVYGVPVFLVAAVGFLHFFRCAPVLWQQFLFIAVITFDGYSQIGGQLLGQTRLLPGISPNKTLEGLTCGIFAVIFTAIAVSGILKMDAFVAVVSGLAVASFSFAGDLLASYYKRLCGVKDFSNFIPGHGGFLDRFDSLIVAGIGILFLQIFIAGNREMCFALGYGFLFLILFLLSEIGYHKINLPVEITRKFVHVTSGITVLSFPFFLERWETVAVLCGGFIGMLWLSKRYGKLPSVHAIDRQSHGSLWFPVSVFICFAMYQNNGDYFRFYLPIAVLAVCDPMAALVGKRWPMGKYRIGANEKTFAGSLAFFVSCMLLLTGSQLITVTSLLQLKILPMLLIAALATITEAVSSRGFDNLSNPMVVAALVHWIAT